MDILYIRKLIKLVNDSDIEELELEESGSRVRITRGRIGSPHAGTVPPGYAYAQYPMQPSQPATPSEPSVAPAAAAPESSTLHTVVSPIVGTFYRAPAPDADSYIQVGQTIAAGTVIGIIEAMKIMNEIESEKSGKVVKILVENGQPVEYNQPLVVLDLGA